MMSETGSVFHRVFEFTIGMDLERDYWQKAPALTAMLRSGDDRMIEAARMYLERAIETQTSDGHLNYNDRQHLAAGHVRTFTPTTLAASLGYPLLLLQQIDPHEHYLDAARKQYRAATSAPRTADGGLSARTESMDLWIDFVYMMCPFFARYGRMLGDESAVDEAFQQLEVHVGHLVDAEVGLGRHAWTETPNSFGQSTFWSRGNGWLGAAIVDLIGEAPDHSGVARAANVLERIAHRLVELQDASGYWRNVLDDPFEPFEASGTLMHAYSLARGVDLGILDESHLDSAKRAFQVVVGAVDEDGAVRGVVVPPGGPGVPYGVTPFGQGFFLLAHQALMEMDQV